MLVAPMRIRIGSQSTVFLMRICTLSYRGNSKGFYGNRRHTGRTFKGSPRKLDGLSNLLTKSKQASSLSLAELKKLDTSLGKELVDSSTKENRLKNRAIAKASDGITKIIRNRERVIDLGNGLEVKAKLEDDEQAIIEASQKGKKVGKTRVHFYEKAKRYPGFSILAKTAILGAIDVDKDFRNKGLGGQMLFLAESQAKGHGMNKLQVPSVENAHFFIENGYYYTGDNRIFEKDLTGKTKINVPWVLGKTVYAYNPSKIEQATREYLELFPAYFKYD